MKTSERESDWNDAKNDRRCELIGKKIKGTLSPVEKYELKALRRQMLASMPFVVKKRGDR